MGKKKKSSPRTETKQPTPCIIPGLLYLGPVSATANSDFLKREGITHVISVGKSPAAQFEDITYHRLSLTDEEDSTIGPVADKACEITDSASASGGKVLVHCSAAISLSPTVVAAYLMKRRSMTLESLKTLVQAKEAVAPNPGFLRQLSEMEMEVFAGESSLHSWSR